MSRINPVTHLVSDFAQKYGRVSDKVISEILRRFKRAEFTGEDPQSIVYAVFDEYGVDAALKKEFEKTIFDALGIATFGGTVMSLADKRWYLNRIYRQYPGLSAKTGALLNKDEIARQMRYALATSESMSALAQRMSDGGLTMADVAKDVRDLAKMKRKFDAVTGEKIADDALDSAITALRKRVGGMANPDRSKLKRAYEDVIDAVDSGKIKNIERSIKYAAYFKERYNAERIATTEAARAYGQGFFVENVTRENVVGWKVTLSSAHVKYDICDFHTSVDLYGMGKGCYPTGKGPEYPFHPWCKCNLSNIYKIEAEVGEYSDEAAQKKLAAMSDKKRVALLGRAGAEAFKADPSSWSNVMKNYTGQGGNAADPAMLSKLLAA
jgi:hypothetical protein